MESRQIIITEDLFCSFLKKRQSWLELWGAEYSSNVCFVESFTLLEKPSSGLLPSFPVCVCVHFSTSFLLLFSLELREQRKLAQKLVACIQANHARFATVVGQAKDLQ